MKNIKIQDCSSEFRLVQPLLNKYFEKTVLIHDLNENLILEYITYFKEQKDFESLDNYKEYQKIGRALRKILASVKSFIPNEKMIKGLKNPYEHEFSELFEFIASNMGGKDFKEYHSQSEAIWYLMHRHLGWFTLVYTPKEKQETLVEIFKKYYHKKLTIIDTEFELSGTLPWFKLTGSSSFESNFYEIENLIHQFSSYAKDFNPHFEPLLWNIADFPESQCILFTNGHQLAAKTEDETIRVSTINCFYRNIFNLFRDFHCSSPITLTKHTNVEDYFIGFNVLETKQFQMDQVNIVFILPIEISQTIPINDYFPELKLLFH